MTKISKTTATSGKRLVFFGNERIATGVSTKVPTLQALIESDYEIVAVVSNFTASQSRSTRALEIQSVAEAHGIPVLLPDKPADIIDQLQSFGAEAAVLVAYGKIVPQSIIDIFPRGIINIHPSLLPLHRGPTPIESVILSGDKRTGVSVMQLAREMDAGPIYAQSEVPLSGAETKQELADKLLEIGKTMVLELLPGILEGSIVALPQDDSHATYDKLITKDDGKLDFTKSASLLEREIRAFVDWPKSRTRIAGIDVIITRAKAFKEVKANSKPGDVYKSTSGKNILITTNAGSLLIERLKPAGKKEMTAEAFLAGHKSL